WLLGGDAAVPNPINPHRPCDVLDLLLAQIVKAEIDFVAHLVADNPADADPARFRERLQPSRNVHPIAVDIVVLDNDITEVDPDAELDPLLWRDSCIALSHPSLDLHPAAHRIHHAGKFGEHSIAGVLDDATAVFGDLRLDQIPEVGLDPFVRAFLVSSH